VTELSISLINDEFVPGTQAQDVLIMDYSVDSSGGYVIWYYLNVISQQITFTLLIPTMTRPERFLPLNRHHWNQIACLPVPKMF